MAKVNAKQEAEKGAAAKADQVATATDESQASAGTVPLATASTPQQSADKKTVPATSSADPAEQLEDDDFAMEAEATLVDDNSDVMDVDVILSKEYSFLDGVA